MTVSGVLRRYFAWLIDSIILAGLTFGLTMFLEALVWECLLMNWFRQWSENLNSHLR